MAGPIGDPNFYAQILLVLIPLALDRLWRASTAFGRIAAAYALFVCSWAFIFTFSRGGLVALAIALVIMLIRRPPRPMTLAAGLLVMLLALPWIPTEYTARITTIFDAASSLVDEGQTDTAMQGRLSENLAGLQIFLDHPLLGVGLNNYPVHYRRYAQRIGLDLRHEDRSAHNLYLQVAAETGILGLSMFGLLLWVMLHGLRQTYLKFVQAGKTNDAEMVMSFFIAVVGYLIAAVFLHSAYPRYFWLLFGIALAIAHIGKTAQIIHQPPDEQPGELRQHAARIAYD
ncbi:O-antigen ligase family protein [Candidatus Entotheonella palauensis]|uniref:O-antigen ligase family protein n=1 Tax=Candidatus Entotheonella palauensis TaxID=93172 RepID=UPI0015C47799|nr:O-antigen ligase family protein [Candidatus Entotheonella palauensis]